MHRNQYEPQASSVENPPSITTKPLEQDKRDSYKSNTFNGQQIAEMSHVWAKYKK